MTREELKAEALINLGSEPAPKEWEKLPCIKEQMPSCIGGEVSLQRFVGTDICAWFVGIGGLWEPQSEYFRVSLPPAEGAKEILEKHLNLQFKDTPEDWTVALIQFNQEKFIAAMREFATLHAQRLAEKMVEEDDLQKLMNDISEWSDKTFGNGQRNPAIIYHLKKEVDELIAAIEKTNTLGSDPSVGVGEFGRQRTVTRVEYADCLMLLLDSAHHFGISAKELLSVTRGKLEINKVRKWGSPDENGVVEHIE